MYLLPQHKRSPSWKGEVNKHGYNHPCYALSGALSFTGNADDSSSLFIAVSDGATVEQNNNLQRYDVEGLVDNLNNGYINGKPTNDYSEAGIFLHVFDGICSPFDTDKCNYNLAKSKQKLFSI